MITLFSTHKNFTGIFDIIQTNALNNWRSISPDIQIIIIGNSKGSKEIASAINADYVPEVKSIVGQDDEEAEGQGYEPYFPKDKEPDWEKLVRHNYD